MTTVLRSAKYNARKSCLKEREKANSEVNGAWSQLLGAPPASTTVHVKLKASDDDLILPVDGPCLSATSKRVRVFDLAIKKPARLLIVQCVPVLCPLPPRGMQLNGGACRRRRRSVGRSVGANAPSTLPVKDDRWQHGAEASRLVFGVDVKPRPGREEE
ncbi:hypothetical protein T10_306 [Trichinella papuae]|uniref:Uncharacterized protein n=1 Tax=Trichinella papuae TaxID=268474 RepID=A0A0V1MRT6_9BILA|nr:hypothetical protein T10_306 [Trichinella papuae]